MNQLYLKQMKTWQTGPQLTTTAQKREKKKKKTMTILKALCIFARSECSPDSNPHSHAGQPKPLLLHQAMAPRSKLTKRQN